MSLFCGVCQVTIDKTIQAEVVSVCSTCRTVLTAELNRNSWAPRPKLYRVREFSPVAQRGFSAFERKAS